MERQILLLLLEEVIIVGYTAAQKEEVGFVNSEYQINLLNSAHKVKDKKITTKT